MPPTALTPGSRLGPYEILSPLGDGGMGEVYRARDTKLNRDVAIKVLLPAVANDPDRLARFEREAKTLALLNHPNICAIHRRKTRMALPRSSSNSSKARRSLTGSRRAPRRFGAPDVVAQAGEFPLRGPIRCRRCL